MPNIRFMLDIDNKKRLTIRDSPMYETLKECIKEFKHGGKLHFDIKKLGVLEVDSVIPSWKQRSIVLKTTLILDYNEETQGELEMNDHATVTQ